MHIRRLFRQPRPEGTRQGREATPDGKRKLPGLRRIALGAALVLTVTAVMHADAAKAVSYDGVNGSYDRLNALREQIAEYDQQLLEMDGEMDGLLQRKAQLDGEIAVVSDKMARQSELISVYDDAIAEKKADIAALEASVDERYHTFLGWLRMTQLWDGTSYLDMILSSDSFIAFLENVERIGTMMEYQNTVIDTLNDDARALQTELAALDLLREEQLGVQRSLEADAQRLSALRSEAESFIATLENDMESYEQLKAEAKAEEDALNEDIERQLREIARQQAAEESRRVAESEAEESRRRAESEAEESRRLAEEESRRAAEGDEPPVDGTGDPVTKAPETSRTEPETEPPETQPPSGGGGGSYAVPQYNWPLREQRRVSSTFGICRGEWHNGIDIPAPEGTAVHAAESGTVITAGYHSSYGNYIIISHSGGYATLYAHCTALYVSVGQTVSRDDVIAGVGNTGYSFGSHLHFEVRKDGTRVEPLDHFAYMRSEIVISIYYG